MGWAHNEKGSLSIAGDSTVDRKGHYTKAGGLGLFVWLVIQVIQEILVRAVGSIIGLMIKLDYNTCNGSRCLFARLV
ncbi:hypothetical protein J1N35_011153, partial [Gossypium stocksii]